MFEERFLFFSWSCKLELQCLHVLSDTIWRRRLSGWSMNWVYRWRGRKMEVSLCRSCGGSTEWPRRGERASKTSHEHPQSLVGGLFFMSPTYSSTSSQLLCSFPSLCLWLCSFQPSAIGGKGGRWSTNVCGPEVRSRTCSTSSRASLIQPSRPLLFSDAGLAERWSPRQLRMRWGSALQWGQICINLINKSLLY